MEVNKLSEELKICLDAGCHNCAYHKAQKVAVCKKLLERAFIVARSREHFEENERHLAPGGKVYAADSSLGVLEYTVDKRISTKEYTELHCSVHTKTDEKRAAALLDKRKFDIRECGEIFFVEPKGAERALAQMRGCEAFAKGDKVYEIFLDEEDAFVMEKIVKEASAEGVKTDTGYLQREEFGVMFFFEKKEALEALEQMLSPRIGIRNSTRGPSTCSRAVYHLKG